MATRSQFDLKIAIRLVAVPLATATATLTHLKIQLSIAKDNILLKIFVVLCECLGKPIFLKGWLRLTILTPVLATDTEKTSQIFRGKGINFFAYIEFKYNWKGEAISKRKNIV